MTTPEAVDAQAAAAMLNIGKTTWNDWVRKGIAPQPVIKHGRVVRWSVSQVRELVQAS